MSMVVEGLFGARATVEHGLAASTNLDKKLAESALENVPYQGHLYRVDAQGVHRQ